MADLRPTVAWLTTMACPWTSQEVADICTLTLSRTRAYLSTLANQGVVMPLRDDAWRAGPKAAAWRAKPVPWGRATYGSGAEYRAEKALKDAIRLRDWQARRAGMKDPTPAQERSTRVLATLTSNELEQGRLDMKETEQMGIGTARTIAEVAQLLGCHADTVRKEIRLGHLRAFRVSERCVRISSEELDAYQQRLATLPTPKEGKAS